MSTITMKNAVDFNSTGVSEEAGVIERFKKYLLNNSEYFAASAVMMTGNSYGAAQIMKNAK